MNDIELAKKDKLKIATQRYIDDIRSITKDVENGEKLEALSITWQFLNASSELCKDDFGAELEELKDKLQILIKKFSEDNFNMGA